MVDFAGILRKAINAQSSVTPQVREKIYRRATETLENKFLIAKISQEIADEQRQILQNAIASIEKEYLAVEKQLLSSVIGWKFTATSENNKNVQNSVLLQSDNILVFETEKKQDFYGTVLGSREEVHERSVSILRTPDAEPVNMDANLVSRHVDSNLSKNSTLTSSSKVDNFHVVSHIFSQALRRTNRLSMQRRIAIGIAIFASIAPLIVGIYLIGGYVSVSNDNKSTRENVQPSNALSKSFVAKRKLTQRLLEDGSEIDVGLDQIEDSFEEGTSTVITNNLQTIEQLGEAIFYQARTNDDAEKVATGNVRWSLVKESHAKGSPKGSTIQGDVTIPDAGLSLRLVLRRNTDPSFPALYVMDLIFIVSDTFLGKAISNIQALTFKASEQSIGQVLTRTVTAKIDDNLFLVSLSGNHPFLDRNLQLMKELDWIRLILMDKNGRTNELTFAKGSIGKTIFNEVIGRWLTQSSKFEVLGQRKYKAN
ncbi:hypothetical protein [Bartonella sp. B41]